MDRHAFDSATSVSDDPNKQRTDARDSLFLVAKLAVAGLPPEQVRVRNLSAGGLMAEYPSLIEQGTAVAVELRGVGEVRGRIAWATDGRIGIAFEDAIDPMQARKPVGTRKSD